MINAHDLCVLMEAANSSEIMDILGRSNVESTVLMSKAATVFAKNLAKAKATRNPEQRLQIWKLCLKDAKAMRQTANNIPPDGIADYTWKLMTSPWWINLYAYGKAAVDKDEKVTEVTKDSTIQKFDMMIAYIEHEIEVCEKKTKGGK